MKVETYYDQLFFITVRIETKKKDGKTGVGTGFLVDHTIGEKQSITLLISNKHVFEDAVSAQFFMIRAKENESQPEYGKRYVINWETLDGNVFGHPDPNIDVAVLNVSVVLNQFHEKKVKAFYRALTLDNFLTATQLEVYDSVEEVIFVGYPNGLYDTKNFLPVIRRGSAATPIMLDYNGKPEFLIDASVFPGSSGSPVLLAPQLGSITRAGKETADRRKVALLGIISSVAVAETESEIKFIEIPTQLKPIVQYQQMLDLGIVIKADAIRETIVEFLKKYNFPIDHKQTLIQSAKTEIADQQPSSNAAPSTTTTRSVL